MQSNTETGILAIKQAMQERMNKDGVMGDIDTITKEKRIDLKAINTAAEESYGVTMKEIFADQINKVRSNAKELKKIMIESIEDDDELVQAVGDYEFTDDDFLELAMGIMED